jgi:hypothetical protein
MNRVRAADDFKTVRLRLEELRRERAQLYAGESSVRSPAPDPDASAHRPAPVDKRYPPIPRRSGSISTKSPEQP